MDMGYGSLTSSSGLKSPITYMNVTFGQMICLGMTYYASFYFGQVRCLAMVINLSTLSLLDDDEAEN